ncbi:TolC family protein [Deminuibacter soli]|uniref:TolC family protein n=1 Tax=Deminuibacter soli TaxID=2291815 RepID=A0A3E1NCG7_9BACT|nr:TolC family protein [Deminuibacter soli]RFM25676.1 TolC family protein [Deminuibacter soli]
MAFSTERAVAVVVGAWLVAMSYTVHAQSAGKPYQLQALTDAAVHHLPVILQKQAQVNSAAAVVTQAKHAALPSVKVEDQLSLATANSVNGSYFPFGMVSTSGSIRSANISDAATGNIGMLYGEYELENFGLNKARVNNAVSKQQLSESDLAKETYLLKLQVSKTYFSLLRNIYQQAVDQQNISRYQAVYEVIQAVTASGIKPGVDSSLALAELSRAQVTSNRRMGDVQQLRQQLSFLTGITDSIAIDTARSVYAVDAHTIFAAGGNDTARNPLTAYYAAQKQLLQSATQLIKKSYLPKILLAASFWGRGSSIDDASNYKSLATGLGYQRYNYGVGVAFVYDLFNGVHRRDRLAENKFSIQASDYALQQQQQALQTALRQSQTAISTAEANLLQLPVQLQAAADAYEQKMAQYRAGIINVIDLTNASFLLYRAQTDYVETLNEWMQANLDKAAATGNLDLFIQSLKN